MGLDMYLEKRYYIGGMYDHRNVNGTIYITIGDKKVDVKLKEVSYIITEAAYWRKANAIHKWFVDNVQDGVDDCKEYRVSVEQLKQLISLCKQVLRNREEASSLLPTKNGPFFGGLEYDEWYFQDIQNTIKMLTKALKGIKKEEYDIDFYYSSSW